MTLLNWKTIEKLEAKIPGNDGNYRGMSEFEVRLGRPETPLRIDRTDVNPERFRIENKTLNIMVEAATLHEAKDLLREKLAASEDFSGKWKLWMKVDADGGSDVNDRYGKESARCTIDVDYVVELTTGRGKNARSRHVNLPGKLPSPFVGEFPVPVTHKELSCLKDGPAVPRSENWNRDHVWMEATPELVETIRRLQRTLGLSGDEVEAALSKKRFLATIEAVRNGGRLLETSLVQEDAK